MADLPKGSQSSPEEVKRLGAKALWLRQQILKMACEAKGGHIASSFSCTEILITLYYGGTLRINPLRPKWPERDRFILGKAQAALGLYPILGDLGFFPFEEIFTFCKDGSRLGGHVDNSVPGVDSFSGSLGHGLSIGCGIALALRMDGGTQQTYVLLGDGECHEGSVWESAMLAGYHRLQNLIAVIDNNGLSASDHLDKYMSLEPLSEKWRSFGWEIAAIDGHSIPQLLETFQYARSQERQKPLVIVAKTVKGKGISFIENKPDWHYRIPVGTEVAIAFRELGMEAPEKVRSAG